MTFMFQALERNAWVDMWWRECVQVLFSLEKHHKFQQPEFLGKYIQFF